MNKRDIYITINRVRAETLRDCAASVPEDLLVNGYSLRKSFQMNAQACDDRIEWARGLTPAEFNDERFKP